VYMVPVHKNCIKILEGHFKYNSGKIYLLSYSIYYY
jgi:hypothetical protein